MKLKCVNFLNPVTIGSQPLTFIRDEFFDIEMDGIYIKITSKRERELDANKNHDGPLCSCVATIYNVVYFKQAEEKKADKIVNKVSI